MEAALTGYEPLEGKRITVKYATEYLRVPEYSGTKHKIIRFKKVDFRVGETDNSFSEVEEPVIYEFVEVEKPVGGLE